MYSRGKNGLVTLSPSWIFKFPKVVENEFCSVNFDLEKIGFGFKSEICSHYIIKRAFS